MGFGVGTPCRLPPRRSSLARLGRLVSEGKGAPAPYIRTVCRHLVDRGHHRIVIDPAEANVRAIRCYEAVGFRRVGVLREYWWNHLEKRWANGYDPAEMAGYQAFGEEFHGAIKGGNALKPTSAATTRANTSVTYGAATGSTSSTVWGEPALRSSAVAGRLR